MYTYLLIVMSGCVDVNVELGQIFPLECESVVLYPMYSEEDCEGFRERYAIAQPQLDTACARFDAIEISD